jgi:N-acetylglucosaminyldiphosphoundecaprenol N-acetyl-beta-D-mannosaminyltransferase
MPHGGSSTSSATASALPTRRLFGLPFAAASLPEVADHVLARLDAGRSCVVVTPNTDHVVRLARDPAVREAYARADVVLADGMPLVWAAAALGTPLPERVTGVDLAFRVAALLPERDGSLFLLGGPEGAADAAADGLQRWFPSLRVAGTHHGFFDPADGVDVVRRINASGATALFVGMGSPRQERWAVARRARLAPRLILCVGGALDVLAGRRRRAPGWMQHTGLEWAYRLAQEPGRLWRRYLVEDAAFVPLLYREWRARRTTPAGGGPEP